MANPDFVHVLVANRIPTSSDPVELITSKTPVMVEARGTAEAVLTWDQFTQLRDQQRAAVKHEPGVLRLVDYWLVKSGKRVELES